MPATFSKQIKSAAATKTAGYIESAYTYQTTSVERTPSGIHVHPVTHNMTFRTKSSSPRLGVMLVGWGGNNGTTVTATILANKMNLSWMTKHGPKRANYFGSITQASTVCLGPGSNGEDVFVPMNEMLPMVHPNDLIIDGWDISSKNLADAMWNACVLDSNLQEQLKPHMKKLVPRPSIYCPDFIAANQVDRADNLLKGTKWEMMEQIRADIRDFKQKEKLDKVIVLWTANTERFCDIAPGLNDTADSLLQSIRNNESEVSPSTIFCVASILENTTYINGSPQNTFVPGVIDLAQKHEVFIGGDDFKSGQTKVKSVIVDFLVSAGIKPTSIVSYNHLGNNDGKNLSAPKQFRSKEISKSCVVDDMVESNSILYAKGEKPDHTVVIKYVPFVGDSKRAMDEYTSEICMGGYNTIVMHNTCEDSLLAAPIILDLIIVSELCERISMKTEGGEFENFHPVLSVLSYLLKAPMVPPGTPVVNALFRQKLCLENIFRACLGLPAQNYMMLEHKVPALMAGIAERKSLANNTTVAPTISPIKVGPVLPQTNRYHHDDAPVENGTPHLNGTITNGVH